MSLQILTLLLCLIKPAVYPTHHWSHEHCAMRATEYYQAGIHENIDPLLLIAIDIKECQLEDKIRSKRSKSGKVDICPMGLRVADNGFERNGMTRQQIIQRAAQIVHEAKRICHDRKDHHWLTHYNTGILTFDSGPSTWYATDVLALYSVLQGKKPNNKDVSTRIRGIINRINRVLNGFYRTKFKAV